MALYYVECTVLYNNIQYILYYRRGDSKKFTRLQYRHWMSVTQAKNSRWFYGIYIHSTVRYSTIVKYYCKLNLCTIQNPHNTWIKDVPWDCAVFCKDLNLFFVPLPHCSTSFTTYQLLYLMIQFWSCLYSTMQTVLYIQDHDQVQYSTAQDSTVFLCECTVLSTSESVALYSVLYVLN